MSIKSAGRSRSSQQRCFVRKGILRNFTKFTGKHLCQGLFFNIVVGPRPATLLKKRLWHKCFPVNFAKEHLFYRTRPDDCSCMLVSAFVKAEASVRRFSFEWLFCKGSKNSHDGNLVLVKLQAYACHSIKKCLHCKRFCRTSHGRWSIKERVHNNFEKFTGKHLCRSLFFNKIAGWRLFLRNTSGLLLLYICTCP